mmetsp:Transcript_30566/g.34757  ORF Transcript_30566/g.34757 Transcript_30566/m.34757 type:complete len:610 (+) Transcript_30566:22-1851(+)
MAAPQQISRCYIDPDSSSLELKVDPDGLSFQTCSLPGFEWLWQAARANCGVGMGTWHYEIRVKRSVPPFFDNEDYKLCDNRKYQFQNSYQARKTQLRVGWASQNFPAFWSTMTEPENHIEDEREFGMWCRLAAFRGEPKPGDIMTAVIDVKSNQKGDCRFYTNGTFMYSLLVPREKMGDWFYPFILVRNLEIEVNFGQTDFSTPEYPLGISTLRYEKRKEEREAKENLPVLIKEELPEGEGPSLPENNLTGFQPQLPQDEDNEPVLPEDNLIPQPTFPEGKSVVKTSELGRSQFVNAAPDGLWLVDFKSHLDDDGKPEVVFTVGLPKTGKTSWTWMYMMRNPQKKFQILSTEMIYEDAQRGLDKFRRKQENVLPFMTAVATEVFTQKLLMAQRRRNANFIIDQSNVLLKPRLEKLHIFKAFTTHAKIFVLNSQDHLNRFRRKELLKDLDYSYCTNLEDLDFLAENFVLPNTVIEDEFNTVEYIELPELEARRTVALGILNAKRNHRYNSVLFDLSIKNPDLIQHHRHHHPYHRGKDSKPSRRESERESHNKDYHRDHDRFQDRRGSDDDHRESERRKGVRGRRPSEDDGDRVDRKYSKRLKLGDSPERR